jgi:hypothetical protein
VALLCLALAGLLAGHAPTRAGWLRSAVEAFRHLRGLSIHAETADHGTVRIRFL